MLADRIEREMTNFGFKREFIKAYLFWRVAKHSIDNTTKSEKRKPDLIFSAVQFSSPEMPIYWLEDFPKIEPMFKIILEDTFNIIWNSGISHDRLTYLKIVNFVSGDTSLITPLENQS